MIAFLFIRFILPVYLLILLGFFLVSLAKIVTKEISFKLFIKKLIQSLICFILILTEKGRKQLFSFKEI